jgi:hypothetical protein
MSANAILAKHDGIFPMAPSSPLKPVTLEICFFPAAPASG